VTPEIANSQNLSDLEELRILYCNWAMFDSDMKNLVTLTNWPIEVALMSQDQSLMRACRDYFDNPRCCGTKPSGKITHC
jgi:hypothetical protein